SSMTSPRTGMSALRMTDCVMLPKRALAIGASRPALMVLMGAVGFVLLIRNFRKAEFYIAPEELPRGTGARTVYGNVGMITFIVLTVLLTAISLFL
ncbi:MAG TPA: hypothetical protein PLJ01_07550, partial [Bifidobacterium adolescentis]|nr:hypothetical protein [Bifidobacterium adolescentis]